MSAAATLIAKTPGAIVSSRVSDDRSKRGRSPDQQDAEVIDALADDDVPVRHMIRELSVSASEFASETDQRKRRAWLAQVFEWAEDPDVDRLACWEVSRLSRWVGFGDDLVVGLRARGVRYVQDVDRCYRLEVPLDRADLIDKFNDAAREAAKTSKRVRRDTRTAAREGKPHGRRLYGYRRVHSDRTGELVRQELEPAEAAVVAEVFERYARGDTLHGITSDLNRRGVPMPTVVRGGPTAWYDMRLRKMLTNPGYLGQRKHQGEVIGQAVWPAIIDQGTWDTVQARLTGPKAFAHDHSRAAKHLLSGIARCWCGAPMYHQQVSGRNGARTLKCVEGRGHNSRTYEPLEAFVQETLLGVLEREEVDVADRPDDPATIAARAELAALEGELDEARALFQAGGVRATSFMLAEAKLLDEIEAARRKVRPKRGLPKVVLDLLGPDARRTWDGLGIEDRRDALRAVLTITVKPGVQGRRGFDSTTIGVEPAL